MVEKDSIKEAPKPPPVQDSKLDTDQTQPSVNNDTYWKQFHS